MQTKFEFIANDVLIKNNKSLKNRGQIGFEAEAEREQYPDIAGIEAYPPGTHAKITVEFMQGSTPSREVGVDAVVTKKDNRSIYQKFRTFCVLSGEKMKHPNLYEEEKMALGVEHLRELLEKTRD